MWGGDSLVRMAMCMGVPLRSVGGKRRALTGTPYGRSAPLPRVTAPEVPGPLSFLPWPPNFGGEGSNSSGKEGPPTNAKRQRGIPRWRFALVGGPSLPEELLPSPPKFGGQGRKDSGPGTSGAVTLGSGADRP